MSDNAASSPREEIAPLADHEARLYINNLPWSVDNEQLTQWITQETQVKPIEVSVVQNKKYGRSRGYAFIKINKTDMQAALTLNGRHLQDRDIGVQEAQQRTDAERAARRAEQAAKREQARAQRAANQTKSAPSPAQAPQQPAQPAQPKKERASRPKPVIKTFDNATTIHFTNLSFKITPDQLKSFVEQAIGVTPLDVTIPVRTGKYRAGQSLGFGFVTVPNDKIDQTLALTGQSLEDRVLKVSLAHVHSAEESNNASTEAAPRQQRPKRRNARRGRGAAKNGANNSGAANNNAAASPSSDAAASPSGQQAAAPQAKRPRNRNRRTPRAGAEEAQ